jgi:hypothetical protein
MEIINLDMLGFTCGKGGLNFEMDRANDKGVIFFI